MSAEYSEKQLTIKELPVDERPREKLAVHGAGTMSNAELIAILLRNRPQKKDSAIRLAEKLLVGHGGVNGLGGLTTQELSKIKGIGTAQGCCDCPRLWNSVKGCIASPARTKL